MDSTAPARLVAALLLVALIATGGAVAATEAPDAEDPALTAQDDRPRVTVDARPVPVDGSQTAAVRLTGANSLAGYSLTLSLDNPEVATITDVRVAQQGQPDEYEPVDIDIGENGATARVSFVDLGDELPAEGTPIARVELAGQTEGQTDVDVTVHRMDDEAGNSLDPATPGGEIRVVENPTVTVGPDGNWEFTTISDAVDAADDGYTVEVYPGTYDETIAIDEDITLVEARPGTVTVTSDVIQGVIRIQDDAAPVIRGIRIEGDERLVTGINAEDTTGDWRVDGVLFQELRTGIDAFGASGDWTVRNSGIIRTDTAVRARETSGDWRIAGSDFQRNELAIDAAETSGTPVVARTVLRGNEEAAIDATDAQTIVNATTNTWSLDGSGPAPDQCIGNVDCGGGSFDELVVAADGAGDFESIRQAALVATDGTRIVVRPGEYRPQITVDTNVTIAAEDGATIVGSGSETAIRLDGGAAPTIDGLTVENVGIGVAALDTMGSSVGDGWRLENLTVQNARLGVAAFGATGDWVVADSTIQVNSSGDQASAGVFVSSRGGWVLDGTRLSGGDAGLFVAGLSRWAVRDSQLTDNAVGVSANNTAGRWRIANSVIRDNTAIGIAAAGAESTGDATTNRWGQNGEGPREGQCVGNVECAADKADDTDDDEQAPDLGPLDLVGTAVSAFNNGEYGRLRTFAYPGSPVAEDVTDLASGDLRRTATVEIEEFELVNQTATRAYVRTVERATFEDGDTQTIALTYELRTDDGVWKLYRITPTESDTDGGGDAVLENSLVTVEVPTSPDDRGDLIARLSRGGRTYATGIGQALRDRATGDTLSVTEVRDVSRDGNTLIVRRRIATDATTFASTLLVRVPEGQPGAVITHRVENLENESVTLNTPGYFIGTDIGLGQAQLSEPGENYRFSVMGNDPIAYADANRWDTFSTSGQQAWATSFDSGRAVTYGLDGPRSASDPKLAMTESKPPTQVRLFGTSVELEPSENAQWRTVVVAHDGGEGAPQRGTELITELLSG